MLKRIKEKNAFTCSFNTTEECNLRCKYCYEFNKKPKVMKFEYAKGFIDHIFSDPNPIGLDENDSTGFINVYQNGLIFDFIGGDSLMNIDLVNEISKYAMKKIWLPSESPLAKRWRESFSFSLSTNGTLFDNPGVKDWCESYKDVLSLGISIDGCPEIHDFNRVFIDGSGSMNVILKNWEWYKKTFPYSSKITKATCNRDSIPYLYKSLKFMHESLGLDYINQNFIMEDMHIRQEDLVELDHQLELCVDYILHHSDELYWSMIDEITAEAKLSAGSDWYNKGWCGSGGMPALSVDGEIYPCIRWLPHTQCQKGCFSVGNYKDGFIHKENFKKVREGSYKVNCTKDEKCKSCNIESACAYCIGGCYAEFNEFKRTTYSCEVNKLRVKWARIYWNEYNKQHGINKHYDPLDIN